MKRAVIALAVLVGFASSAWAQRTIVSCQEVGDEAGLESLKVVRRSNSTLAAKVEVSGPGDFIEDYTYAIKARPAPPRRLGAPLTFASADGKSFVLSICSTCAPLKDGSHAATLTFIGPKSSQMNAGATVTYQNLACEIRR